MKNLMNVEDDKPVSEAVSDFSGGSNFVPSIKITSKTSDAFAEGKCKLGHFYLNETDYGDSLNLVAISYRFQAIQFDNGKVGDQLIIQDNGVKFESRDEVIKFREKHGFTGKAKPQGYSEGIDILCYLPDTDEYAVLFCKGFTRSAASPIIEKSKGGNILNISTKEIESKYGKNYILDVTPTGEKVGNLNEDKLNNSMEIYESQTSKQVEDKTGRR